MTWGGQSERLFEAYASPSPAQPLFQAAVGNLNRRSPTTMGTQNSDLVAAFDFRSKDSSQTSRAAVRFDRNCCPPKIEQYPRRQVATGVPLGHFAQVDPNGGPRARRDCP
jgi:hypothetical protein